jgi:uncharacterized delta-60 repeat protein
VAVVRLKSSGRLDSSFHGGGVDVLDLGGLSNGLAVALPRGGKIVIAGSVAPQLQVTNALIARLTPSGTLDRSFASGGIYTHQYAHLAAFSSFNGVAVEGNGTIVAAGAATAQGPNGADALLVRFSPSGGQRSVTYAQSAMDYLQSGTTVPGANAVAVSSGGEVFATGLIADSVETKLAVWAFRPSGALDTGFGSHGVTTLHLSSGNNSEGAGLALEPSGALVVAGDENHPASPNYSGLLARYVG